MPENPFDKACRYALVKLDTVGLMAWLLRVARPAFSFQRWVNTRNIPFPGEKDRICDTVAHLNDETRHGIPWAVPFEFQIAPDPEILGRGMIYLGNIWLEQRPDELAGSRFHVGMVVVNLTGVGEASREMNWPEVGLRTQLGIVERNLQTYDAEAALDQVERGEATLSVLSFIPLFQNGEDPGIIQKWKELALREPNDRRRSDYGALALVFAEASNRRDVWKEALKEWNMQVSQQVLEWQQEALARGRAEGRAEGLIQGQAEAIISVLEARFGSLPPELSAAIRQVTDLAALKSWLAEASRAQSIDKFRQAVGL